MRHEGSRHLNLKISQDLINGHSREVGSGKEVREGKEKDTEVSLHIIWKSKVGVILRPM